MKIKRKPRKKVAPKYDVLFPIPAEKLGSEDDPCFGKFFDPRTPECSRCGDSEICSIVMAQKNKLKVQEFETKHNLRDVEENDAEIVKRVSRAVRARFKEVVEAEKEIEKDRLIDDVHSIFFDRGYTKKRLRKILRMMVEKKENLIESKNKIKWKK